MEARYGRNRKAVGDRRLVKVLAVVLGLALVAFIFWAAFGAKPNITGTVTSAAAGQGSNSTHQIQANITFSNPSGKPATCQVSATLDNGASVGSKQVQIPSDAASAQQLTIVTVEPATGAVVDFCWTN
jgi:Domain of unknown function (DUF4307)